MTLVRKVDGAWQLFDGINVPLTKMVQTATLQFADGRSVEIDTDPYPVEVLVSAAQAEALWNDETLIEHGLRRAVAMEIPEGKQAVARIGFVERPNGSVEDRWSFEDIPPPPPPPTAAERLAALGLSREDLIALLAGE